jgi:hypothetical protein
MSSRAREKRRKGYGEKSNINSEEEKIGNKKQVEVKFEKQTGVDLQASTKYSFMEISSVKSA